MKTRITPLNFATAFFVVLAIITWVFKPVAVTGPDYVHWTGTIAAIFIFFAFVLFFLDMVFRNFFYHSKTLWMVELSFIVLTVIIYLIVRK